MNEAARRERRAMDALRAKCVERGVVLRFMANGMARRRTNTTIIIASETSFGGAWSGRFTSTVNASFA